MTLFDKVDKSAILFFLVILTLLLFQIQNQKLQLNQKVSDRPVLSSYSDPISVNRFFVLKFAINEGCNIAISSKSYENIEVINNSSIVTLDKKEQIPLIYKSISLEREEYEKVIVDALYKKNKWKLLFDRNKLAKFYELRNQLEKYNWVVKIEGITEVNNGYITIKNNKNECNFARQLGNFENINKKTSEIALDITKFGFEDRFIIALSTSKNFIIVNNNLFNLLIILSIFYIIKSNKYYLLYLVGFIVGVYYVKPIPVFIYPIIIFIYFIFQIFIKSKYIQLFLISGTYIVATGLYRLPVYSSISYGISILGFIIFIRILMEQKH
jgi:hypothetical protein